MRLRGRREGQTTDQGPRRIAVGVHFRRDRQRRVAGEASAKKINWQKALLPAVHCAAICDSDGEKMPLCRVIEYQSNDMDRFSIQCGVSTTPPETVSACSGTSRGLPA